MKEEQNVEQYKNAGPMVDIVRISEVKDIILTVMAIIDGRRGYYIAEYLKKDFQESIDNQSQIMLRDLYHRLCNGRIILEETNSNT